MSSLWRFYSFGACDPCVKRWPMFPDGEHHRNPNVSHCHSVPCLLSKEQRPKSSQ